MKIGKLIEVDVRELWRHEQYDFSNWLALEENIDLINEIIGLNLVDIQKEVYVGSYRCDLVAQDEASETTIIIENQLEISDHNHLGKIITYASGLSAEVIIWIVKEARAEHRSAIEWINNNTNKKIGFFLLELHAYKIGDSLPAPKFEVIEMPNDFIKNSKIGTGETPLNKSQSERLEFWTLFNEMLIKKGKPFSLRKPSSGHWYSIALGTSDAHLGIVLINKENYIGIEIYIKDNKDIFDNLLESKEIIENKIDLCFEWNRLDNKKASRIIHKISGLNFDTHSNYEELMDEVISKVLKIKPVFTSYLNN